MKIFFSKTTIVFLSILAIFCLFPLEASADKENQTTDFFVDIDYDLQNRETVSALLRSVTNEAYFYIEEYWYDNLTEGEKEKAISNLEALSLEFSDTIYPVLTENYGTEWNPGIDSDKHITVLFHRMQDEAAGYFRTQDETSVLQSTESNEREIIYLNSSYLLQDVVKSYLAHEFTHLITFNQKDRLQRVTEEIWLNELRAEYASTLLGYDDDYINSNLAKRIDIFLDYPSDSLTEWTNKKADYGVISAFTNYLVDNYGKEVLTQSIKSKKVGIASLEEALQSLHTKKEFQEIFSDWLVAVFLNNCGNANNYCYQNENLKYIKINPSLIFLPPNQKSEFTLTNNTTYWAGNWYRIIGGADNLEVTFNGEDVAQFKALYILCKQSYDCSVNSLELNEEQNATLVFDNFIETYSSLILMPFLTSKISGFNGKEEYFNFSINTKATPTNQEAQKQELIASLKVQIADIQQQIVELQAQLSAILGLNQGDCSLYSDLYIGIRGNQVVCLQEFLTKQGIEIYPEGQVTGYFGPLTRKAVINFQQKYAVEILHPLNITQPTGFVGLSTRTQVNKLNAF